MTYKQLVNEATKQLEQANIYVGFARVLMLEMLREQDLDMYTEYENAAPTEFQETYQKNVDALCKDIPLGYVLGYEWFFGYKIMVNEGVLIPRGETEELVGNVLSIVDDYFEDPTIADVATGSGAIAIALANDLNMHVYATDISKDALDVAQDNVTLNEANVTLFEGDMLAPLIERDIKLDVLVCNPPYIKNTEHIQSSVLTYEPHVALFGGNDGLFFYRSVLENAPKILKEKAVIAFEIGFDIGKSVVELAKQCFPHAHVELRQDINGLDRMVFIYIGIQPQ